MPKSRRITAPSIKSKDKSKDLPGGGARPPGRFYDVLNMMPVDKLPPPIEGRYTYDLFAWAKSFKHSLLTPLSGYLSPVLDNVAQPGYWALYYLFNKYTARKEELPNHRDSTIEFSLVNAEGNGEEQSIASVIVWQVHKKDDQTRRTIADSIGWIRKTSKLRASTVAPAFPRYIGAVRTTYMPEYLARMAKKELSGANGTEFFYVITTHTGVSCEPIFKELESTSGFGDNKSPMISFLVDWTRSVTVQILHAVMCACQWYGLIFVPNENNYAKISNVETTRGAFLELEQKHEGELTLTWRDVDFQVVRNDLIKGIKLHSRVVISSAEWIDLKIYEGLSDERRKGYRPITTAIFDMVKSITPPGAIPEWLDPMIPPSDKVYQLYSHHGPDAFGLPEEVRKRLHQTVGLANWEYWIDEGHISLKFFFQLLRLVWRRYWEWDLQLARGRKFDETPWGTRGVEFEIEFMHEVMQLQFFIDSIPNPDPKYIPDVYIPESLGGRKEMFAYFPKPPPREFDNLPA